MCNTFAHVHENYLTIYERIDVNIYAIMQDCNAKPILKYFVIGCLAKRENDISKRIGIIFKRCNGRFQKIKSFYLKSIEKIWHSYTLLNS